MAIFTANGENAMNPSYIARAMKPLVEEVSKEYSAIVCMAGDVGAVSADALVLPAWAL